MVQLRRLICSPRCFQRVTRTVCSQSLVTCMSPRSPRRPSCATTANGVDKKATARIPQTLLHCRGIAFPSCCYGALHTHTSVYNMVFMVSSAHLLPYPRHSGDSFRAMSQTLSRVTSSGGGAYLLAVPALIAWKAARLFEASSCPWTPRSPFDTPHSTGLSGKITSY